ncbi:MAG: class I SAM-dependent methyltransferase [Rhodothermales bacterium]
MDYDPIKDSLGRFFCRRPFLQRSFYALLDLFFLRAWHVHRTLRRLLAPRRGQPLRVLDAGTGFGQYAHFIVRTFPEAHVLAVDVKRDYLANLRRFIDQTRYADRVETAYEDLTDLKAEGSFDLILCVDVMEHIEEDRAVFRHFARVLAPGGYVLINTPSDLGGSDVGVGEDSSFIGEHVRDGYNMDELKGKLADAGLTPVEGFYTYGAFGSLAWRMMIKYPMKLLGLSRLFVAVLPLYYLPVLPIGVVLHAIDVRRSNPAGTGVIVVATQSPR